MNVNNIQDMYYQSSYNGSQTLDALNAIYDLKLDRKYYQPKELNRKLKKISGREVWYNTFKNERMAGGLINTQLPAICFFITVENGIIVSEYRAVNQKFYNFL